jgi:hypothetical protein
MLKTSFDVRRECHYLFSAAAVLTKSSLIDWCYIFDSRLNALKNQAFEQFVDYAKKRCHLRKDKAHPSMQGF